MELVNSKKHCLAGSGSEINIYMEKFLPVLWYDFIHLIFRKERKKNGPGCELSKVVFIEKISCLERDLYLLI